MCSACVDFIVELAGANTHDVSVSCEKRGGSERTLVQSRRGRSRCTDFIAGVGRCIIMCRDNIYVPFQMLVSVMRAWVPALEPGGE